MSSKSIGQAAPSITISFGDPDIYDSEKLFKIPCLPKDVLVVGGGAIGCVYASIFCSI